MTPKTVKPKKRMSRPSCLSHRPRHFSIDISTNNLSYSLLSNYWETTRNRQQTHGWHSNKSMQTLPNIQVTHFHTATISIPFVVGEKIGCKFALVSSLLSIYYKVRVYHGGNAKTSTVLLKKAQMAAFYNEGTVCGDLKFKSLCMPSFQRLSFCRAISFKDILSKFKWRDTLKAYCFPRLTRL